MNIKDILPGYKTIITGWVTALSPVALLLGFEIDPEAVNLFVEEFSIWLMAGWTMLGAAIAYFRRLANQ